MEASAIFERLRQSGGRGGALHFLNGPIWTGRCRRALLRYSCEYRQVIQEDIETLVKDGELYVRKTAVISEEESSWVTPFAKLAAKNSQKGETVVQITSTGVWLCRIKN